MIPIYRAFSETFDKYILGVPYFSDGRYYMLVDDCNKNNNIGSGSYPIDETTLAIHLPDMLAKDSNRYLPNGEKDLRIFASLSENGKGGDICFVNDYIHGGLKGIAIYQNYGFKIDRKGKAMGISLSSSDIKIIGIQQ